MQFYRTVKLQKNALDIQIAYALHQSQGLCGVHNIVITDIATGKYNISVIVSHYYYYYYYDNPN